LTNIRFTLKREKRPVRIACGQNENIDGHIAKRRIKRLNKRCRLITNWIVGIDLCKKTNFYRINLRRCLCQCVREAGRMTHGSEKRARTAHITIRLTPEERAAIDSAAERAGLTPGSYARSTVLGAPTPRQVRRPPVERKELARLLGAIGHIGGNLNQLAHARNAGMAVARREIITAIEGLATVRDAILSALGREP
jgi:hypothetical protein